jgi:hypothetical protein
MQIKKFKNALYLEELVNIYKPARSLRSENNTTLVTPIVRTKSYGERRFDKAAASITDITGKKSSYSTMQIKKFKNACLKQ